MHAIQPSSTTFQLGQKLCFSNILSTRSEGDFSWASSNPKILDIDSASGCVIAKAPGQSTISETLKGKTDKFTTSTVVTVTEPTSISLEKVKGPKVFTDTDDEAEYLFAVKFHGPGEAKGQFMELVDSVKEFVSTEPLPYNCEFQISPPSTGSADIMFKIEPAYISPIGYACVLKKISPMATSFRSLADTNATISIWATRNALVSDKLIYSIHSSIIIQPTVELTIDNEQASKAMVRVTAPTKDRLHHVKVTLSNDARDLFTMNSVPSSGAKHDQRQSDIWPKKEYVVRLISDATVDMTAILTRNFDAHVSIIDETTNSIHRLPIRLKLYVKSPAEQPMAGGILGFLWNLFVGAKEVYGTVVLIVVSALLTIFSVYFGKLLFLFLGIVF